MSKGKIKVLMISIVLGSALTISICNNNSVAMSRVINNDLADNMTESEEDAIERIKNNIGLNEQVSNNNNGENQYYGNYIQAIDGEISISPKNVYYDNGNLVMKAYVHNGLDYQVSDIGNVFIRLGTDTEVISEAYFGELNNAVISPKSYVEWTFTFDKSIVEKSDTDLSKLYWESSCKHSNNEYYLVVK